jgi:hypothetical protein
MHAKQRLLPRPQQVGDESGFAITQPRLSLMKTERTRDAWRKSALPILVIVIGALLLAIKVYVDSEPGAIPLLLVAGGSGWYLLQRFQPRWLRRR